MDAINTFVFEIWPRVTDIISGVGIVGLAACFIWSIFFEKKTQPPSIPEPDDELTVDPQEISEDIADTINEVLANDPSTHLDL